MISTFFAVAFRNILKNRRRSLVTLLAFGVGFAALSLFRGYTTNVFEELRSSAILDEGLGHLTISKEGWREKGSLDPEKYLLTKDELDKVAAIVKAEPGVVMVSPKLNLAGLASNGKVSQIFIAEGVVPEDFKALSRADAKVRSKLSQQTPDAVEIGEGLARLMDIQGGEGSAVLSGVTLAGQMNAIDVQVVRAFNTGVPDTNDKFVRMPLELAQQLYETDRADRILVLLNDVEATEATRTNLLTKLRGAGLSMEIKTWEELSVFFAGTNEMLGILLSFMGSIVLVIVVMSVINTMGVAVMERTREIGTLRALGLKKQGTVTLFALEGAMLGVLGCLIGTAIHTAVWAVIKVAQPMYTPPGFSEEVPFVIAYVPEFLVGLGFFMVVFALFAAILPASRASKQSVVVSLGHI
ncbi:ABC transporter permease [Corallococcus sp. ZKHCc1 1396]|uniref:ABC transporter permease n=1 Tax=Corallococcus soli TaxID=2710757 RepID=A0ABR9PVB3_9BACT|nr:FtsX-like permease family protein [Corallococcus soli]MBE4751864.1 ABC transporter permease [Corallococcus soli]